MLEVCAGVNGVGDTVVGDDGVEEGGAGGAIWPEADATSNDATSNDATSDDASSSVRGDVANGNK